MRYKFSEEDIQKIEEYKIGHPIREYLEEDGRIKQDCLNQVTQIIRKIDDEADYIETPCEWKIVSSDKATGGNGLVDGYIPTLKLLNNDHYALCASSFYSNGYNDEVCVPFN